MKKLLTLFLALTLLLSLTACPDPGVETPTDPTGYTFTRNESWHYTCQETGITYRLSTPAYVPHEASATVYGTFAAPNGAIFSYYKIRDMKPEEYLAHLDDDFYPQGVLYSGERMPTLPEMDCTRIYICDADEEFYFNYSFDMVGDTTVITTAVNYQNAEPLAERPSAKQTLRVELLFESETYNFFYNLSYLQFEDGTAAFLDPGNSRYYPASFTLFDGYRLTKDAA